MTSASQGLVRVEAPDELASVLRRDRLAPLFRCEIVTGLEGSREAQVYASGPASLAAVLASTR